MYPIMSSPPDDFYILLDIIILFIVILLYHNIGRARLTHIWAGCKNYSWASFQYFLKFLCKPNRIF